MASREEKRVEVQFNGVNGEKTPRCKCYWRPTPAMRQE
jgi:hypothetical protein